MTDTSDLEWWMTVDVDELTAGELGGLMGCLAVTENGRYGVGLNEQSDNIYLSYDRGMIRLELDAIYDEDMENVLTKIADHKGRIIDIGHSAIERTFERTYSMFGPQFFDGYTSWTVWKETSGFNEFAKEVYDDE